MLAFLREPWPWYVSGPLIGLFVPALLLAGNRPLGMSGALRGICAMTVPGRIDFFRYDWRRSALWSVALGAGILIGAALIVTLIGVPTPPVDAATARSLGDLGLAPPRGLVPAEVFSWRALFTARGAVTMLGGGFLVGFGSTYGGGCTSGHGITGLATLQKASILALIGIFAGGIFATYVVLPSIL